MLPHRQPWSCLKSAALVSKCFHCCHAVALPRGERGEVWPVFGGTSGISCGRTGQMWRAVFERQDEEERILFQIKALLSLSLFLPLLYKSKSQHFKGGYCQIRYIVLTVWWYSGSGYPIHQWNVRENNMGRSSTYQRIIGLGTHQQKLYREWSRQQIICSKFRTISNDQSK